MHSNLRSKPKESSLEVCCKGLVFMLISFMFYVGLQYLMTSYTCPEDTKWEDKFCRYDNGTKINDNEYIFHQDRYNNGIVIAVPSFFLLLLLIKNK
jgi:hypothetical protein